MSGEELSPTDIKNNVEAARITIENLATEQINSIRTQLKKNCGYGKTLGIPIVWFPASSVVAEEASLDIY